MRVTRREFGGLTVASLAGLMLPRTAEAAGPLADMPAGAIDVHNHIVGPLAKYPMAPTRTYTPPEASVAQLRALRTQLGVARNVIVQPSFYGFDNSCLVDALAELGTTARGVAVVPVDVTDTAFAIPRWRQPRPTPSRRASFLSAGTSRSTRSFPLSKVWRR
jgi:predicted TIM-barrel fold metal-dependent hydrolase